MKKPDTTKKKSKGRCMCCKINFAEINNAYCTFCREQIAKGNLKFDLFPSTKK